MRPPPAPRCISGGTAWFSAAKVSAFGRNRSAAFGTRTTSLRRAISIVTVAVIPGLSFSCVFGTSMTVAYVTTFCVTMGCRRTCDTAPTNSSSGYASTRNLTTWPARMRPTSDSSTFAFTCIFVRSSAMMNSVGAFMLAATV